MQEETNSIFTKTKVMMRNYLLMLLTVTIFSCSKKKTSTPAVAPDYTAGIAGSRVWEGSFTNDTTVGTVNTSATHNITDSTIALTIVDKTHITVCGLNMPFQSIDSTNKIKYFGGDDVQVTGITGEGSANLAWYYATDSISYSFITSKGTIGMYMNLHTK